MSSDLREKVNSQIIKIWVNGQMDDPTGLGSESITDRILPLVEAVRSIDHRENCNRYVYLEKDCRCDCGVDALKAALDKFWKGAKP